MAGAQGARRGQRTVVLQGQPSPGELRVLCRELCLSHCLERGANVLPCSRPLLYPPQSCREVSECGEPYADPPHERYAAFRCFFFSVEAARRHMQTTRAKGTPTRGPHSEGAEKRNQRPCWPVPGLHLLRSCVSNAGILFLVSAILCV